MKYKNKPKCKTRFSMPFWVTTSVMD
jgi:hypothetical protein